MDTIDPKMAANWETLSWARHYDELDQRFEKLCDALYQIVGLEDHELETARWTARIALQEVNKWPN
jgi:hypothetical protein